MPTEESKANNDAQIREVIGSWAKTVRAKDVEGAMACLTPDILTFDLAPPLQHEGLEVIRKSLEEWLPTWDGPIGLEIRDLRVTADRDVAFCTSLQRMSGTKTDGEKPDLWLRPTMCLQKIDGTWRIAHEHTSTPFYMDGSNKAALDLKP
ncbi:MAG: YybH family protein [Gammaproteobacteria bacterium]